MNFLYLLSRLLAYVQAPWSPVPTHTINELADYVSQGPDASQNPERGRNFSSAPDGFPQTGNGLWYTKPARLDAWSTEWLPIGNGYIAASTPGETQQETMLLNIESLWSGGPFEDPNYNGGNQSPSEKDVLAQRMQRIRQGIFDSDTGTIPNIEDVTVPAGAYGSYSTAGALLTTLAVQGPVSHYYRWLDMDTAVLHTEWFQGGARYHREAFCSHPAQACIQYLNVTGGGYLPHLTYAFAIPQGSELISTGVSCFSGDTLRITGRVKNPGMSYEILVRVFAAGNASVLCASQRNNATLHVQHASEVWIAWVGDTEYSMYSGNPASNYTFRGADPDETLRSRLSMVSTTSSLYTNLLDTHISDYRALMAPFLLDLGQIPDFAKPTDELKAAYRVNVGDSYLEWLLFNYGRYLLAGSARGALPANLQGKWGPLSINPWGADSNINIQMNYWFSEQTNMDVIVPLFDFIEHTWVPRGRETAETLYNISRGWVVHNEVNIFGHSGMKWLGNSAQWADYPEAAVWMMIHVWDHFDYTGNITWFRDQGWPLMKGVAEFHLDKLIEDLHFKDGTLVTAPCNSPEQLPITFGCAHSQHLIWQLFNSVERGFAASGDTDIAFLEEVREKRAQLDKGIHIGSWGQLQEWKVDMDRKDDTHRHLSHLLALYPGYAIASYDPSIQGFENITYSRSDVLKAAEISLLYRGNGTGLDADAGWEKVWRAACWAQLQNASQFYFELSYAIEQNFALNLFSEYMSWPWVDSIFQIDANFGYSAAVLNALVQAPDVPSDDHSITITLLPALPPSWSTGSVKGLRLRGGMSLDMEWINGEPISVVIKVDRAFSDRLVQVLYSGKEVTSFLAIPNVLQAISFS